VGEGDKLAAAFFTGDIFFLFGNGGPVFVEEGIDGTDEFLAIVHIIGGGLDGVMLCLRGEVDIDDKIKVRFPPPKQHYTIKPSPYYMNNREKFIGSINTFFNKYRAAISKEKKNVSCKKRGGEFITLTHSNTKLCD
jgi:hypothetical protein